MSGPGVSRIFDGTNEAPIIEKTTRYLSFTLKDELGAVIPGPSLNSLFFKLYKRGFPTVFINARDGTADLKANVNGAGLGTFELTPSDNVISDQGEAQERHIAAFEWTYNTSRKGRVLYELVVYNEASVT